MINRMLLCRKLFCVLMIAATLLPAVNTGAQVIWNPSPATGNLYMTAASWTGGVVPGTTAWAQIGNGSSTTLLVQMSGANNNGTANQAVGAIEKPASRSILLQIGSVSLNGALTLNGATVNGIADVVLSNSSSTLLSFPTSSPSLRFNIPGSANRNFVTAGGSSSTAIGSTISLIDTITSIAPLTFLGGGTWNGTSGNAGGLLRFTGGGQDFSGGITVGKSDGTESGVLELDAGNTLKNVTGNDITVNPNSELFLNPTATATFATNNIILNLKGKGNPVTLTTMSGALVTRAAISYTWQGGINLAADAQITTLGTGTLTVSGNISGSNKLIKTGSGSTGSINITGTANTWSGGTEIQAGAIIVAPGSSISAAGLAMTGTTAGLNTKINFYNAAQTITSLSSSFVPTTGTQLQSILLGAGHVLTLDQSSNTEFGSNGTVSTQQSVITGAGSLIKNGTGRLTLSSNGHDFYGGLTINNGELRFNPAEITTVNMSSCPVTLNGGRLSTTGTATTAQISLGVLTLSANSTIDLGTATNHSIKFAASAGASWTTGIKLNITNWTGAYNGTAGTAGRIFVGTSASDISTAQLAQIEFRDGSGNIFQATVLSTGEIVPTIPLTATLTRTNLTCNGAGNGAVSTTVSGGSSPYNYVWTGPSSYSSTSASISSLGAGFYTVTVTDALSATLVRTVSVTQPASIGTSTAYTTVACHGGNTGNAGILASGGTSPYIYTWSTGTISTATTGPYYIYNLVAGSYTVRATDANGCNSATRTIVITQPGAPLTATVTATTPAGCGLSNGTANIAVSGGTPPYSNYSWAPSGGSTSTGTAMPAGTYTLSFRDINNCSATQTVNIITTTGSITGGNTVCATATITLTGAGATGVWSSSNTGVATVGSTGVVTGMAAGTTGITFANSCGTASKIITVNPLPDAGTLSGALNVCTTATTALSSSGDTGGMWSSGAPAKGTISAAGIVTGIAAGTTTISYTVTNGCGTANAATIVSVNPATEAGTLSGFTSLCTGAVSAQSSTVVGGTWSSGNTTIGTIDAATGVFTALAAGSTTISYTVSDVCGTAYASKELTVNTVPAVAAITGSTALVAGTTTILISATPSGVWSSTNPAAGTVSATGVLNGLAAGNTTISYTITNTCGATAATVSVTVTSSLTLSQSQTNVLCHGATTGNATVIASGGTAPYNYAWTGSGSTTATASGLAAGNYTCTVTDHDGTIATSVFTISEPATTVAAIAGNSGAICSGSDLTLAATASGGTAPYTYLWSGPATYSAATQNPAIIAATAVASGTYTLAITDANGCMAMATTIATVNARPAITAVNNNGPLCAGSTLNLTGSATGTGALSYSWSGPGGFTASMQNPVIPAVITAASGAYTLTVTDAANCTATGSGTTAATINAAPDAISGGGTVAPGGTLVLTNTATGGVWSSTNTAKATVDATGLVSGVSAGSTAISYTIGSCAATLAVTVGTTGGTVIVGNLAICVGTSTNLSNTEIGTSWTISDPSIASIGVTSGVVTGLAAGTATIIYTSTTGVVSTAVLTVNTMPAAISGTALICAGSSTTLSNATTGGIWSSSNTAVAATTTLTGVVSGMAAGTAIITYNLGGCVRAVQVTVSPMPGSISGPASICSGSVVALSSVNAGGTWVSSNTAVATIGSVGMLNATSTGTAVISYTISTGCMRTTTVTITSGNPITGTVALCPAQTSALSNASGSGTWTSSNTGVATINSASGMLTAVGTGTAVVTYAAGAGCNATRTVTVATSPAIITGTLAACVDGTTSLGSATTGGVWSSSNAALGTVSAAGVVTGIAAGTPVITYAVGSSCYRTIGVTIKALPGAITGNTALCTGRTTVFANASTGVSWTSSTPSVATIGSASGVVTGVASGTSTITFLASTGCYSTRVVTVDIAPSVGAITGLSSVGAGATITLADATAGGVWTSANTAKATVSSTGVVSGIAAPVVTISYTVTNGVCQVSVTKALTVTASKAGGSADMAADAASIRLYPNPTTGAFTVFASGAGTFTIYSLEGKELQQTVVAEGINSLTLPSGTAAGMYMCRFSGADGSSAVVRLVYE